MSTTLPGWLFDSQHDDPRRERRHARQHAQAIARAAAGAPLAEDANAETGREGAGRRLLTAYDDVVLVTRLRESDVTALEVIVRDAFDALAEFAASYLHSRDAAEDVVQHILIKLWEDREALSPTTRLRPYLYTAVRHRAFDALKHERVVDRFRQTPRDDNSVSTTNAAEHTTERADEYARLTRVLAMLTPRQCEAVRLRYQAQLTVAEVAATLGVSVRGTERLLERALAVLREAMRR